MQLSQGYLLWVNRSDFNAPQEAKAGMPPKPCDQVCSIHSQTQTANLGQLSHKGTWQQDPQPGYQTGVQEQTFASKQEAARLVTEASLKTREKYICDDNRGKLLTPT